MSLSVQRRWSLCLATVLLWTTIAVAQEPGETAIDRGKWSEFYLKVANRVKVRVGELGDASPSQEPFFYWANPVREGRTAGDFFIWFADDQPVLVGTIFSYDWPVSDLSNRAVSVELHGLSEHSLEVNYAPQFQWKAPANAVQSRRLANTPPPRDKRVQRLVEMRRIAKRVEASTQLHGQRHALRLLPTPLYRFDRPEVLADDEQVLDGAVFALVTGTDPELLVVIQALRVEGGQFAWFLTTAGFTNLPLTVRLDGKVVSEAGSSSDDPLYFDWHRIHVVPTQLGPRSESIFVD